MSNTTTPNSKYPFENVVLTPTAASPNSTHVETDVVSPAGSVSSEPAWLQEASETQLRIMSLVQTQLSSSTVASHVPSAVSVATLERPSPVVLPSSPTEVVEAPPTHVPPPPPDDPPPPPPGTPPAPLINVTPLPPAATSPLSLDAPSLPIDAPPPSPVAQSEAQTQFCDANNEEVLLVVGVIPPRLLKHLSLQGSTLLDDKGSAVRIGGTVNVRVFNKWIVDLSSYDIVTHSYRVNEDRSKQRNFRRRRKATIGLPIRSLI